MNILIPVRYPLTDVNKRAIKRGIELVDGREDFEILIFYLNEVQKDTRVSRKSLREAVESSFPGLNASYMVRDGFLIEEAIVEAAIQLEMDYIILSTHRRDRWRQLLEAILDIDQNPEQFIRDNTGIEVEVITETGSDSNT
jgi:nucleotide-binding universal stress UspA family protein